MISLRAQALCLTAVLLCLCGVHNAKPFDEVRLIDKASASSETSRLPSYFPNTEQLGDDEMRVTALGTGLPTPITRAQKSTAWMVELGNGDVFLFDRETGAIFFRNRFQGLGITHAA